MYIWKLFVYKHQTIYDVLFAEGLEVDKTKEERKGFGMSEESW